jgi:5-methylcytosine-specific restriction endonuclease McrA
LAYKDKADQARYAIEHREKNRQKYRDANKRSGERRRDAAREFLVEYLLQNPCVDCGEDDIVVLEFDHLDPSQKLFTLGVGASSGDYSLKKIEEEIAKCAVRCANCHRKKTARDRGYFRHLVSEQMKTSAGNQGIGRPHKPSLGVSSTPSATNIAG